MRLNELLKCVPLDSVQFKNYKRRDQLPFRNREKFSIAPGEKLHSRWTDYSIHDALCLQLMVNLSEHKFPEQAREPEVSKMYEGLPPKAASVIASEAEGDASVKYGDLSGIIKHPKDIWHVAIVTAWPHEGELWYGTERFSGPFVECAEKIEKLSDNQVRATTFNVSQALRGVLETGREAKIQEVLEFLEKLND